MKREDVFRTLEQVDAQVLEKQQQLAGGVERIEHTMSFVDNDFSLGVWAFYATDRDVAAAETDGRSSKFRSEYLEALRERGYDPAWLNEVLFVFDSAENVEANYEGRYFYRLR